MVTKKRGLSDVITTLIIILLVVVAAGILWVVLRNMINKGTEQLSTTDFTTDLQIQKVTVNADSVDVKVKMAQGESSISGILVSISDGTNSQTFEEMVPFNIQEEKTLNIPYNGIVSEIAISPIVITDKGQKKIGQVSDTYKYQNISSGTTCTPNCAGKVCGGDLCGGSCGTCSGSQTCTTAGQCYNGTVTFTDPQPAGVYILHYVSWGTTYTYATNYCQLVKNCTGYSAATTVNDSAYACRCDVATSNKCPSVSCTPTPPTAGTCSCATATGAQWSRFSSITCSGCPVGTA